MSRIWAIAINTFREAVRDRVLYGVLGAGIAVLIFTLALGELSLNEQMRVVQDVGLATISLFAVVIAVFLGSSLLYKEIERKTLYVILPKPIHRHEFLLGKFVGIVLTALVFVAQMGAVLLLVMSLQAGASAALVVGVAVAMGLLLGGLVAKMRDQTAVLVPWSFGVLLVASLVCSTTDAPLAAALWSLALTGAEAFLVAAVALLFSSFSTPFLTGVFSVGLWLVGRGADEMATMRSASLPVEIRSFLHGLAWVVPNFNLFVPGARALSGEHELTAPGLYVATSAGYALFYATLLLTCAALIFRRRDFV